MHSTTPPRVDPGQRGDGAAVAGAGAGTGEADGEYGRLL